jgi:aminopeptidase N
MVSSCAQNECRESSLWNASLKTVRHIFPILIVSIIASSPGDAQLHGERNSQRENALVQAETQGYQNLHRAYSVKSSASVWFDATYYGLNLRISTSPFYLSGIVTIRGTCLQDGPQLLSLDLTNTMHIDSVEVNSRRATFYQQPSSFTVSLDSGYHAGDVITMSVMYGGVPLATGLGSFVLDSHSGTPWVWSLSEPYGARDWWPCRDEPGDKADSVDVIVTADSSYKVGSNGSLLSIVTNQDGTKTTHWKELYPIATYLVSVAITNFAQFSNWFHYSPTDSLEVLNYVLPESLSSAQMQLPRVVDGLGIFSALFGLYPFVKEKYGHSEFGTGAMEHQTMTSTSTFNEDVIIHELAHQWFGDMITCASWSHLWLNEGFATYCTALYHEMKYGPGSYFNFINPEMDLAKTAVGSVFAVDTSDVRQLFNSARVYSKGASVLHMLRHVLGDSVFFRSMRAYANRPSLRFRSATTANLQAIFEETSGKDLGYFFDEWIYGESYPHYLYSWDVKDSSGMKRVTVTVNQSTGTTNPSSFIMPIDFKIIGGPWDSTVTVVDSLPVQVFSFSTRQPVDSVQFDSGDWILKSLIEVPAVPVLSEFALSQNYPNPFNSSTTIGYTLPLRANVRLSIFNVLGERVAVLESGTQFRGPHVSQWNPDGFASGIYFYELKAVSTESPATTFTHVRKMLLIK